VRSKAAQGLLLGVTHQPLRTDFRAVDVAGVIDGHAFRGTGALFDVVRVGDEILDRAVLGAADADAALPAVAAILVWAQRAISVPLQPVRTTS
jgi:hypothetical protein